MHVELQFAKNQWCAFIFRGAVLRMTLVIACGAGPSTQLNPGLRRAVAGPGHPYIATAPGFFSYSLALPRPAVLQLRPAGARGMRGVRSALSCQEAWY